MQGDRPMPIRKLIFFYNMVPQDPNGFCVGWSPCRICAGWTNSIVNRLFLDFIFVIQLTIVVWGGFLYGSNRRTAVPIQLTCEEPMARWRTVLYIVSETSFMMSADLRPCETRGHHFLKMGPRLRRGAPVFHTGSIALSAFNNI